jgi:putative transposase
MKKSRFSEQPIISILKQIDAGVEVQDICRQHGISDATYYKWKSNYGGMEASDIKRLRGRMASCKRWTNACWCGVG